MLRKESEDINARLCDATTRKPRRLNATRRVGGRGREEEGMRALVEALSFIVYSRVSSGVFREKKVLEKNTTSLNFITSTREKKKNNALVSKWRAVRRKKRPRRRRRPKVRLTVPEEKEKKRAAPRPRFHNALRPKRTPGGVQSNCRGKRATSSTTP